MTVAAQLSLFELPAKNGHDDTGDDLLEQLEALVAEDGMSDTELAAVIADALEQLAPRPTPPPCRCIPAGLELDEPRCWRCGRQVATTNPKEDA